MAGPAKSPQRTLGFKYPQVMYAGISLSCTAAQLLQAKVTTMPLHVRIVPNKLTDNKITFSVSHSATPDGRYKNAFGLIGHFLLSFGNRNSSAVPGMPLNKYNFFQAKLNFYLQTLSETAPLYDQMEAAAATYLFNLEVDSTRHPKIAALLRNLRINCGDDVSAFKAALLGLEGAHAIVEDDVLLVSHQLIGPSNPGAVRISDELANRNPAIAYAKSNGRNFSMAQGYSLHPDGTLIEHTVDNTRAYTEIDGLDDGRPMFAIVSFEGVLNFTAEGRLYYRVGAHLHRYTLLDVDGTLPRAMSTPSRDRLSGNPVDDFDD
jgi:hypothetical protein